MWEIASRGLTRFDCERIIKELKADGQIELAERLAAAVSAVFDAESELCDVLGIIEGDTDDD